MNRNAEKAYDNGYVDMAREVHKFAKGIESDMFATADNLHEAISYTYNLIETLPQEYKAGAYTGLHVILNTVAQELRRLTKLDLEVRDE